MSLPRIASYALPREDELPAPRVSWQLDVERAALLVHDVQTYFLDCYQRGCAPIDVMLQNIARLRALCERLRVPVVYTAQPAAQSERERGLLSDMWGAGITTRPLKVEIEPTVRPRESDTVLTKWRYSAFAKTSLREWLRERGRDQLVITGVYTHIGCQTTALDAFMRDIQPFVVSDATADFSREHQLAALRYVAGCAGVVLSTSKVVSRLTAPRATVGSAETASESLPGLGSQDHMTTRQLLRREVARLLSMDEREVPEHANLLELGLDSMRLMSLTERISELGFEVDFLELSESPVLSLWCEMLATHAEEK